MTSQAATEFIQTGNEAAGAKRLSLFFFFLLASGIIPNPPFILLSDQTEVGFLKVHHLLALSLVGVLFESDAPLLTRPVWIFLAVGSIATFFAAATGTLGASQAFNFYYCIYCAAIGTRLFLRLGQEQFLSCLRIGGRFFAAALIIEVMVNFGQFVDAFSGVIPHPDAYLNSGGVNIEGSYVVILAALEMGGAWFWPMAIFGVAFGAGSASRSAEVGALFVMGWRVWLLMDNRQRILASAAGAFFAVAVVPLIVANFSDINIVARLASTAKSSDDIAIVARYLLWYYSFQAFLAYPFGYGPGAAAPLVARASPEWGGENNVHDIYLQFAVDLGIQGLLAYLFVVSVCLWRFFVWSKGRNAMGMALLTYLILAVQEFRAYDQAIFLFIGALTAAKRPDLAGGEELPHQYPV